MISVLYFIIVLIIGLASISGSFLLIEALIIIKKNVKINISIGNKRGLFMLFLSVILSILISILLCWQSYINLDKIQTESIDEKNIIIWM